MRVFTVHVIAVVAEFASLTVSIAALEDARTSLYDRSDAAVTSSEAAPQLTVVPVELVLEKATDVPTVGAVVSDDADVVTDAGEYRLMFPTASFTSTAK